MKEDKNKVSVYTNDTFVDKQQNMGMLHNHRFGLPLLPIYKA